MNDFDTMLEELFEAMPDSLAAVYTPTSGNVLSFNVLPVLASPVNDYQGPTRIQSEGALFEVRRAALPAPARAAQLQVTDKLGRVSTYVIKSHRPPEDDPAGLIWVLDCALR